MTLLIARSDILMIPLRSGSFAISMRWHVIAHFGRAAATCAISQSALSMQIKELEDALGAVLNSRASLPNSAQASERWLRYRPVDDRRLCGRRKRARNPILEDGDPWGRCPQKGRRIVDDRVVTRSVATARTRKAGSR